MSDRMMEMINKLDKNSCDDEVYDVCCHCVESKDNIKIKKTLNAYRQELLKEIEGDGKQIDCIDYLIYDIKKYEGE